MAQKVQTLFFDDLDGSEAEGTVRFGLDGTEYEIDLNAQHARQLRDALARYVAADRRVGAGTRRPARGGRKAQPNALNTTEVREWAKAQGIDVKDRGRYYSCCFSVCDRAAAQRGWWLEARWLHAVTSFRPSRVRWRGLAGGRCSGASGRGPGGVCAMRTSGGRRRGGRG